MRNGESPEYEPVRENDIVRRLGFVKMAYFAIESASETR
jgi:hypothetical protein